MAYGIMNGYQGMVDDDIKLLSWEDVGGIMNQVNHYNSILFTTIGRYLYWNRSLYGLYETRRTSYRCQKLIKTRHRSSRHHWR